MEWTHWSCLAPSIPPDPPAFPDPPALPDPPAPSDPIRRASSDDCSLLADGDGLFTFTLDGVGFPKYDVVGGRLSSRAPCGFAMSGEMIVVF